MDPTSSYFTGIMTGILLTGMILGLTSYNSPAAQLHRIEKLLEAAQSTAAVTTIVTTTVTQAAPPPTTITVTAPAPGSHSALSCLNAITYGEMMAGILRAIWLVAVVIIFVLIAESIRLGRDLLGRPVREALLEAIEYYHEELGMHYDENGS